MATLTNLPSSVLPGVKSGTVTLDPASLITEMNITDPYYSISTNWNQVIFIYTDNTGKQNTSMTFVIGTNTSNFMVSSHARQNSWLCKDIIIIDFDNGSFVIPRSSFPTQTEFDVSVSALPSSLLYFNPATANAGSFFTDGTSASGTTWREQNFHTNNASFVFAGGATWHGTGITSDPYRLLLGTAGDQLDLSSTIWLTPPTVEIIQYWVKLNPSGAALQYNDNSNQYLYYVGADAGDIYIHDDNNGDNFYNFGVSPATNVWKLYGFRRVSGQVKLYINGVLSGTINNAGITKMSLKSLFKTINSNGISVGEFWVFQNDMVDSDFLNYFNQTKSTYGL